MIPRDIKIRLFRKLQRQKNKKSKHNRQDVEAYSSIMASLPCITNSYNMLSHNIRIKPIMYKIVCVIHYKTFIRIKKGISQKIAES
jgi:hypothetical protein